MQFSKVNTGVTTHNSNRDKQGSYAKGKTRQERETKPGVLNYYTQAANSNSDDEELKTSIPCSDKSSGNYEYCDADPSTSDASDNSILRHLPASDSNPQNARLLFECREKACRAVSTEETLGFCGTHFIQRYRKHQIDIPTVEDIRRFRTNRRSFESYVPHSDDDDVIESFNYMSVQPSKTCSAPMCSKPSDRENGRFCAECLSILECQSKQKKAPTQRKRLRCPGCNEHGLVTYNGLCGKCYTILCNANAEQIPIPDAEPRSAATHRSDRGSVKSHKSQKGKSSARHIPVKQPDERYNGYDSHVVSNGSRYLVSDQNDKYSRYTNSPIRHRRQPHLQKPPYDRSRSETPPNPRRSARRTQSDSTHRTSSKSQLHAGDSGECSMNRQRRHARNPNGVHLEDTHGDYVMVDPHSNGDSNGMHQDDYVMVPRERSTRAELSHNPEPRPRTCRSQSCNNYGNEKSNGYCNQCSKSSNIF